MWWLGWSAGMVAVLIFVGVLYWWVEFRGDGRPSRTRMAVQNARQEVDGIFQSGADEMVRIKLGRK